MKSIRLMNYTLLLLFLGFLPVFSQEKKPEETIPPAVEVKKVRFSITSFEPKDISRNSFKLAIKAYSGENLEELYTVLKRTLSTGEIQRKKIANFTLRIDSTDTDLVPGTIEVKANKLNCEVYGISEITAGNHELTLVDKETNLLAKPVAFEMPERLEITPMITSLEPSAGAMGDTITIKGRDFGERTEDITIYLIDSRPYLSYDAYGEEELTALRPSFVSRIPDSEGLYSIKFTIPSDTMDKYRNKSFWRNPVRLRVLIQHTPAAQDVKIELDILRKSWKFYMALLSIGGMLLLLITIALMVKRFNFLPYILLDRATNTYSLSKFQAFVWTITLFGSYLYVAICNGILKDGKIPDFNVTLLGLMGISYGGLISANHLNKKNPKNEINVRPPSLSNLIMQNGMIDITRLQLFGFTMLTIYLYFFNLYNANILDGMPDIPNTLHGLLLSSQGGYLGGKMIGDKTAVNHINPSRVSISEKNITISLIGSGFVPGMKVMIDNSEPIMCEFIDPTAMKFKVNGKIKTPGFKNILLIPQTGSSTIISDAIEFVAAEHVKTEPVKGEEISEKS